MIPFSWLYQRLLAAHGPQGWWPADGPLEIMAGALLVQRTTWEAAETALAALRRADLLSPTGLAKAPPRTLEGLVRPAGFYRTKAARLRGLGQFLLREGGVEQLAAFPTGELRRLLLTLPGIGPETADAIVLYAFGRPVVVIDAYLRRLSCRLLGTFEPPSDDDLRASIASAITATADLNEFHALVIAHGKTVCAPRPDCSRCALRSGCRTGGATSEA